MSKVIPLEFYDISVSALHVFIALFDYRSEYSRSHDDSIE